MKINGVTIGKRNNANANMGGLSSARILQYPISERREILDNIRFNRAVDRIRMRANINKYVHNKIDRD